MINAALHAQRGQNVQMLVARALFWIWGRVALRIFEHKPTQWRATWVQFFQKHGVNAQYYSQSRVDMQNVVYLKVSIDHAKAYVGSTKENIVEREATRRRAFAIVNTDRRSEPALIWWDKTSTFWDFCPIVVVMCDSEVAARDKEFATIEFRKPELVAPRIWRFFT